jgi:hypothetical protein
MPSFAGHQAISSTVSRDAEDEQSEQDTQDIDMIGDVFLAVSPTLGAGSAARASAAEHNQGKAAHVPDAFGAALQQQYDQDEDMSDDVRITKRRRACNSKFASHVSEGDNGYDSMEIDNGVDEFTDRRRSKPPARTGT